MSKAPTNGRKEKQEGKKQTKEENTSAASMTASQHPTASSDEDDADDIPPCQADFTESISTGLDWFVRRLGLCFAAFEWPQGLTDISDFADVRVTDPRLTACRGGDSSLRCMPFAVHWAHWHTGTGSVLPGNDDR
jgi:hypothetical protein